MPHRIFVDANVLIAGAASRTGASRAVLRMAEIGLYTLVVSRQVLDETERNSRKKLPQALADLATLLAHLNLEIVPDPTSEQSSPWKEIIEQKDAPILTSAILAEVDRFLTLNTKDFTPVVAEQTGLVIQSPAEFVREVRGLIETGL
jgi:predicted nucleic acid-binding protein